MRILFCADPRDPRTPDASYADEVAAAKSVGLSVSLVNFEALVYENDAFAAVRRVAPADAPETAVFRGWMLTLTQYQRLYDALAERNVFLVNTPTQYRHCHYLPESYSVIKGDTPETVWLKTGPSVVFDEIHRLLTPFGSRALIVKDFVKSRKHEWAEACFIPDASDQPTVERVVKRFLELQGSDLNEGLVFREFVEFAPLAAHSKSGMPLTKEYRVFVLDGQPIQVLPYWDAGGYDASMPPLDGFLPVIAQVRSRFFTMDVAELRSGGWQIVELGDGQVAGLPEQADPAAFYQALQSHALTPIDAG